MGMKLQQSQHSAYLYLSTLLRAEGFNTERVFAIFRSLSREGLFIHIDDLSKGKLDVSANIHGYYDEEIAKLNEKFSRVGMKPTQTLRYGSPERRKFSYELKGGKMTIDFAQKPNLSGIPIRPFPIEYMVAFTYFKELLQGTDFNKGQVYKFINKLGKYCVQAGVHVRSLENSGRNVVNLTAYPSEDYTLIEIAEDISFDYQNRMSQGIEKRLNSDLPILDITLEDLTTASVWFNTRDNPSS